MNISYEDPYDSEKMVELPFVLGVMSDLSGNASAVEKPDMEERDCRCHRRDAGRLYEKGRPGLSFKRPIVGDGDEALKR